MRNASPPRRAFPRRGFTLVELMVSLAVLALLTALATPSFADFFERSRVRAAGDDIVSLVGNARAEAVKNDLDVSIAMRGAGTSWCLGANAAAATSGGAPAGAAPACDCTDPGACQVGGQRLVVASGDYGDVSVRTALASDLFFDSTLGALAPLGTGVLTLTSPSGKYDVSVQVGALGQARLCTPPGRPTMSEMPSC